MLRYLSKKSDCLGEVIKFYQLDNSKVQDKVYELFAWTGSLKITEVITLSEFCGEQGWIKQKPEEQSGAIKQKPEERSSGSQNTIHELMLRPPGYARLAELDGISAQSDQAFVAMWFDDFVEKAYEEGIKAAIKQAGYKSVRIDRKDHNNKIDDEIIAEIRRSRFVVADFTEGKTGSRGGVYYEAGFAHGMNKPVIFTCRESAKKKVHFDTRQYNHIFWETPEELCGLLFQRISATIGDGPNK